MSQAPSDRRLFEVARRGVRALFGPIATREFHPFGVHRHDPRIFAAGYVLIRDLYMADGMIRYVPYDFDLAGIVNARYARPAPEMDLRSVRQRRYRGFCADEEILLGAIRKVASHRQDIVTMITKTPGFTEADAEETVAYLERFFERAKDEEKMLRSFRRQCLDP